ncbi:MAG: diguanylate cyclase [Calditerrivibrio sp.]|nr:diguanylate cyclase [Calditerrivibrio sp.]MCA1932118.1 diguanylate cyclase [Calditerrivibrio sp.]
MGKVNDILKENQLLKKELEGILELISENELKAKGLKIVEYAFLLSENIEEIDQKPMVYLEEIFEIDKAALFLNIDELEMDISSELKHIFPMRAKAFNYFFIEKRPYLEQSTVNLISEFNIMDGIGSYLIAPIIINEKLIGSLNLYSRYANRYSSDYNSDFIKDLCFKIGISISNIKLKKQLMDQSFIDESSGCYNKKAMYNFLGLFINRCYRYNQSFSFILIDFDDFKKINDKKGHLVGDQVLSKFGQKLTKTFRKSDIIGRFGGDEFYIITPETDSEKLSSMINKAESILSEIYREVNLKTISSLSYGKAIINQIDKTNENPETIFQLADTELYRMKKEKNVKR